MVPCLCSDEEVILVSGGGGASPSPEVVEVPPPPPLKRVKAARCHPAREKVYICIMEVKVIVIGNV